MSQFVKPTWSLRGNSIAYSLGGKAQVSNLTIKSNEKLLDYEQGTPCPNCHMIKDVGVKGACEYCLSMWCKEDDSDG
jgi:hypothetical protein